MTFITDTEKTKSLVKKHVNAIHCSNNLTLVQRKLFNALLFNAYNDMPKISQYEISIKKLCQIIGYGSRDYKKIRKSLLDLITTSIEWNVLNQSDELLDEKWRASAIISAAKIENGICTYEFSSIMRELLYQPEIYGKIDLGIMTMFGSGYGLALYENCVRFQDIPQTPWFPLEVFRKLIGVSKNSYLSFCDFKKRVLDVAVKEVNKFTPIQITAELQRSNKKVTKIRFKLKNDLKESRLESLNLINGTLVEMLSNEFNLSFEKINELMTSYEANYILSKIQLIQRSNPYLQGKIKNLGAYLIDALAKDYKKGNSVIEVVQAKRLTKELDYIQQKQKEDSALEEKSLNVKLKVKAFLQDLSENKYNELIKSFEEYLRHPERIYMLTKYQKTGLSTRSVQAMLNTYVYQFYIRSEEQASM